MSNFLASNLRQIVSGEATTGDVCPDSSSDSDLELESETPLEEKPLDLYPGFPPMIDRTWRLDKLLGEGTFGRVYQATHVDTGQRVAVKVEVPDSNLLLYEAKIYEILNKTSKQRSTPIGYTFIPQMHWTREVRRHHCLAIDLLGDSIETIKDRSGGRISVKDGLLLGMQMLEALRFMHSRAIIHRDIKSDNIVIGLGKKQNVLFLIDYGLAKQYCNPKTQEHIPYRENKCLTGTPRFASINNHLGIEQSRRDDIEALAYVIVYLIKGILPWQGIKIPKHIKDARKYKNKKILDSKMTITTQELCRGVPRCVEIMLQEARALRFQDKPPYYHWIDLFGQTLITEGHKVDWAFSWIRP